MTVVLLRAYLLAGLLAHKAVWEVMRRRQAGWREIRAPRPQGVQLVIKLVKTAILAGIVAQTLVPDRWVEPLLILDEPASLRLIGVILYTLGLAVAVLGRVQLGSNWADIETAGVHSKQQVVSRGVYRLIRHPIYTGDLLLLAGLELALNSWLVLGVLVLVPVVTRQAVREEQMLRRTLEGYDEYCRRTKRFVPFVA